MSLSPTSSLLPSHPHRRLNLLTGKWILVSPHRTQRPWLGQEEKTSEEETPEYDPTCYLCPSNARANGGNNPAYTHTYVFVNDYSALLENQADYVDEHAVENSQEGSWEDRNSEEANGRSSRLPQNNDERTDEKTSKTDNLLLAGPATGRCLVLSFTPSHRDTFADLGPESILAVVNAWTKVYIAHISPVSLLHSLVPSVQQSIDEQMASLFGSGTIGSVKSGQSEHASFLPSFSSSWIEGLSDVNSPKTQYKYLQIIENKGAAMGCSNRHPHGQIWITDVLPDEPGAELQRMEEYRRAHPKKGNMLVEYAKQELHLGDRVVFTTQHFVALCPWWASWPFEVLILPHPGLIRLSDTNRHCENGDQVQEHDSANLHIRSLLDLSTEARFDLAVAINRLAVIYDNLFEIPFPYSMGIHQAPIDPSKEELESSCFHLHFYPPLLRSAKVRKFWAGYELLTEAQRDLTPEVAVARLRASDKPLYRTKSS